MQEERSVGAGRVREVLLLWVRPVRVAGVDYAYVFSAANPAFDAGLLVVRETTAIGRAAAGLARRCRWGGAWEVREEHTGRPLCRRGLA